MTAEGRIQEHLTFIYGKTEADFIWPKLQARLAGFRQRNPELSETVAPAADRLSERDVILITYGDQISEPGKAPLATLGEFLEAHLQGTISGVHLLPFFPYSSDDGFSVIDYKQVNPTFGDWDDLSRIGRSFDLMFDAVINHISRESEWFQALLRDESPFTGYFITEDPDTDLSMVVRPRALPLLTAVDTAHGTEHVWTTFSEDQIDLNYASPDLLLDIVDVLLFYVEKGAALIRLDAIAYLWKEAGTPCIHLPQTHHVVKLFRAVLDAVAPQVLLITETNVPHEENISYFGDSVPETGTTDEAQLVYQFPLAPLVLHTFLSGNSHRLAEWASVLDAPRGAHFFNFIASHDGIGVMPSRGILSEGEIDALVERTLAHGGRVSYKTNSDGSKSVYELNASLFDALSDPGDHQPDVDARRFLASQAILLSLAGVPGIYVHSLLGSRHCHECIEETGRARSINREKFQRASLEAELADPASLRYRVFNGYRDLLRIRRTQPAFNPNGTQRILPLHDALFALVRTAPDDEAEMVLCLIDVSGRSQTITIDPVEWDLPGVASWRDLISGEVYSLQGGCLCLAIGDYQTLWLKPL